MSEQPYFEEVVTYTVYKYNPKYGDNQECVCGHAYYRHFDSYENMEACGCKYCSCNHFVEGSQNTPVFNLYRVWIHDYVVATSAEDAFDLFLAIWDDDSCDLADVKMVTDDPDLVFNGKYVKQILDEATQAYYLGEF